MTSDRFDLTTEVAEAAVERSSAWRFVARFAECWLGEPLDDTSGVPAEQIELREADLGVRLSPAVREFYGLVGRRSDLFRIRTCCCPSSRGRCTSTKAR